MAFGCVCCRNVLGMCSSFDWGGAEMRPTKMIGEPYKIPNGSRGKKLHVYRTDAGDLTIEQLCLKLGISRNAFSARLRYGWDSDRIFAPRYEHELHKGNSLFYSYSDKDRSHLLERIKCTPFENKHFITPPAATHDID